MPVERGRYPANWKSEIVPMIRARSRDRCEWCGVPNHAVGYREADGHFVRNGGNLDCDAMGRGEWSYAEAIAAVETVNVRGIEQIDTRLECSFDQRVRERDIVLLGPPVISSSGTS